MITFKKYSSYHSRQQSVISLQEISILGYQIYLSLPQSHSKYILCTLINTPCHSWKTLKQRNAYQIILLAQFQSVTDFTVLQAQVVAQYNLPLPPLLLHFGQ